MEDVNYPKSVLDRDLKSLADEYDRINALSNGVFSMEKEKALKILKSRMMQLERAIYLMANIEF